MLGYIVKRLLLMIPTLFGVAVLIFLLLRVVPGDVVEARYLAQGSQFQSQELMAQERKKLGLDQPMWKQFTTWMAGLVRLDFGLSMWTGAPITEEIKLRFALSLQLALMASTVATEEPLIAEKSPVASNAASGIPLGKRPIHDDAMLMSARAMPPPWMKPAAMTKNGTAISVAEFM